MRSICHRLSRRRCNGADQVNPIAGKTGCDIAKVGLIRLSILEVKFDVLALYETLGCEAVDKALVGSVKRLMFDKLNNTDVICFSSRGLSSRSSRFFIIAAGNGQDCGKGRRKKAKTRNFHICTLVMQIFMEKR